MKKKLLSILLTALMMLMVIPSAVFADDITWYKIFLESSDSKTGSIDKSQLSEYNYTPSYTVSGNTITLNGNTATATPALGFEFKEWRKSPYTNSDILTDETHVMPSTEMSVKAYFKANRITVSSGTNGTIDTGDVPFKKNFSGEAASNTKFSVDGDTLKLSHGDWSKDIKAIPDNGYKFVKWTYYNLSDFNTVDIDEETNYDESFLNSLVFIPIFGRELTYSANNAFGGLTCSDYASGSAVPVGASVSISGFSPVLFQLDFFESNILLSDKSISGNTLTFTMPDNKVSVVGYFSNPISSVDLSFDLPVVGDTSYSIPTVNPSTSNYVITDLFITDDSRTDIDPSVNPFEDGKTYILGVELLANNGFSFKYAGDVVMQNDGIDADEFAYNVTTKVNGEAISAYTNDAEMLEKSGYNGCNSINHNRFTVIYTFKPLKNNEFINDKIVIPYGYKGTVIFKTSADYNEESDVKIKIDNNLLTLVDDYNLSHGSTIIELLNSCISGLSAGTHTISVDVKGYETISQEFIVKGAPSSSGYIAPKTGIN